MPIFNHTIGIHNGSKLTLPLPAPVENKYIFVYREGKLMTWGRGLSRVGDILFIEPALDEEFVYIIYYT